MRRVLGAALAALLLPACKKDPVAPPVAEWTGAALLESSDVGNAVTPHVACNVSGEAVTVWSQTDGLRFHIWAAQYSPGTGWLAPVQVENNTIGNAELPRVAIGTDGAAVAVWQQHDGIRWNIGSARCTPAGSWGVPELIENDDVSDALEARVVLDGLGHAVATWSQTDAFRFNLWANVHTPGVGWGGALKIEGEDLGNAGEPALAADGAGRVAVVWSQFDGTRYNIRANRHDAWTGWAGDLTIETEDTASARHPRVAMDGAGNAFAVWEQFNGIRDSIRANRMSPAGAWGASQLIENDDTGSAWLPQVGADGAGNALAVWQQHDGFRWNILSNRFVAGVGWGVPQSAESYGFANAEDPRLAVDGAGRAVAAWRQFDGIRYDLAASRNLSGTASALLEAQPGTVASAELAIDGVGRAHAVWSQSDGLRFSIWCSRSR